MGVSVIRNDGFQFSRTAVYFDKNIQKGFVLFEQVKDEFGNRLQMYLQSVVLIMIRIPR